MKQNIKKGFTLIELLIVLGIMGILISVILAAINPTEQILKAQDASKTAIAGELMQSINRYSIKHQNAYPWDSLANGGDNCYSMNATGVDAETLLVTSNNKACLTALANGGELNSANILAVNPSVLQSITITSLGTGSVSACFLPISQSFINNSSTTKYNIDGTLWHNKFCPSRGCVPPNYKYICVSQ